MAFNYHERVAAGLCGQCGERPPVEGLKLCAECRDRFRAERLRHRAAKRAAGLCERCGHAPVSERVSCIECYQRNYGLQSGKPEHSGGRRPRSFLPWWTVRWDLVGDARQRTPRPELTAHEIASTFGVPWWMVQKEWLAIRKMDEQMWANAPKDE